MCSLSMLWKLAVIAALAIDVSGNDSMPEESPLEAKEPTQNNNKTEPKNFVLTDEHKKEIKKLATAVCTKSNKIHKSQEVNDAMLKFINCSQGLFNPFAIQDAVVEARKNGTHGEVIKKQCELSENLKGCIHGMTAGVFPCVPTELQYYFARVDNITDALIDYVCENNGTKITDFITENGTECFTEKSEPIMGCVKALASGRKQKDMPISVMCKMYDQLTKCVVTVVQGCQGLAPSKMAESLLVKMRDTVTDCPQIKNATIKMKSENTTAPGMEDQDDLDSEEQNKAESGKKTPLRTGEL